MNATPRILPLVVVISLLCACPVFATNYSGNGDSGFSGAVGLATFSITDNPNSGIISFVLNAGGSLSDDMVMYIDSVSGGFNNNSQFNDNGDGGREAISGENSANPSRVAISFPSGFGADYAISVQNNFAGLYQLAAGGNNSLNFISSANETNPSGNIFDFNITASQIGLTAGSGQSFSFVCYYLSTTAYGSNESIGASTTTPDSGGDAPNAGFNGTVTFTGSNVYTLSVVPEPATFGLLACGAGVLLLWNRRSRNRTV